MRLVSLPIALILAVGCRPDDGNDTASGTGGKDTGGGGDTGTPDYGPAGCINLNGVTGDFGSISEAVAVARDGDSVMVCAGSYSEKVVLDRAVAVVGAGSGTTAIDAPVNEPAFEVDVGGASVSGFTITSTRSGVTVDAVADVTLSGLSFSSPANYGVEAAGPTDLMISGCTFTSPAWGGVFLSGGSATVETSSFDHPVSYGIWATGGATLVANGNTFTGVVATASDGSDGHAIFADGSDATTSANVIDGDDLIGIWAQDGSLTMSGDTITNTPYAILALDSAFNADGLQIYGATSQGIYAVDSAESLSLTNSVIALNGGATTDLVSCDSTYDESTGFCGGVLIATNETITISGVSVSDYESYGLEVSPYSSRKTATVALSDVSVDNAGRYGLAVFSASGTVDGASVTNTREPDPSKVDDCTYVLTDGSYSYSVDRGVGFLSEQADLVVTNAVVDGSEGWGMSLVFGTMNITGSSISAGKCAGLINYQGGLEATGNTFSHAELNAAMYSYQGSSLLSGNTFENNTYESDYSYDDGAGGSYRYTNSGYGQDIYSYLSSLLVIDGNTFANGDNSVAVYQGGATITDNVWSGYNGTLVTVYYGDASDPVVVDGGSADDIGGGILQTWYGDAEASNLNIGTTRAQTYHYASYHTDSSGVETLQYEGTSEYGDAAFRAYGYYGAYWSDADGDGVNDTLTEYGDSGSIKLTNISMGYAYSYAVEATDSNVEIDGLDIETANEDAIYAYWDHYTPQVEISDVSGGTLAGSGIVIDANSGESGYPTISGVDFTVVGGNAVEIDGMYEWSVDSVSVLDTAGYGLTTAGDYYYYDYSTSTYYSGVLDSLGAVSDVQVTSATLDGISILDGSVAIDSSSAAGGDAGGLSMDSVEADINGNSFTGNGGFGMVCTDVTLASCSGNDLSGNVSGTHLGCDDACGL